MSEHWDWQKLSHQSTIQFAIEGIRALLLANGGAVVAILSFAGNAKTQSFSLPVIAQALGIYAAGLAFAIFTCGLSYLAQLGYTHLRQKWGDILSTFAVAAALFSLAAFVSGSMLAGRGFIVKPCEPARSTADLT